MVTIVDCWDVYKLRSLGHVIEYEWVFGSPRNAYYEWVHIESDCSVCWEELFCKIRKVYDQDVSYTLAKLLGKEEYHPSSLH